LWKLVVLVPDRQEVSDGATAAAIAEPSMVLPALHPLPNIFSHMTRLRPE
jgi:hypothetical protein